MTKEKAGQDSLYQKLKQYSESDYCGFHMPGHKRRQGEFINPYHIDITEIEGFDDLHHPEEKGILALAQERAARLYGASETHFLVNGSTAGILSAVSGCTSFGGHILIARNCHRSVYHAAELRNLRTSYLYPQFVEKLGINGGILPEDVKKVLEENPGIQAVILPSPTYDGICSDVRCIAEECHSFGVPLLVDQAHGAHFPFSAYFPEDALRDGADVVIHSVHKTLPALTQTALLHINGELVDRERICHYLSVYQSSSPSYVLLASIDSCMEFLETKGREKFEEYTKLLEDFRESCHDLCYLKLAGRELEGEYGIRETDSSKLLISCMDAGISGKELADRLRERYHIETEMSAPSYVLGISSTGDRKEDFDRLSRALHEIDEELKAEAAGKQEEKESGRKARQRISLFQTEACMTLGEAFEREQESVKLEACEGRICGSYIYVYPPGIPLLAPGERISAGEKEQIETYRAAGLEVHGLKDGRISVLL